MSYLPRLLLLHSRTALRYMQSAGYVHRDISPGNLLYFSADGTCKISDLEYAKPYQTKETLQLMDVASTKAWKTVCC